MTSMRIRRPCAKCKHSNGVAACNGCHQMFCLNHFTEHRDELSKLMDNISQDHDILQGDLCQENLEHPFLSRIDNWEQDSIKKIQTAAQAARVQLQQIFNRKKEEIKPLLETLTNELQYSRDSSDYTENDIDKWTGKLKTFRKTLEHWSTIDLEDNNNTESTIHFIKINDNQQGSPPLSTVTSSEQLVQIFEEKCHLDEKFDKIDSDVDLSEDNLIASCRSYLIFTNRFIYGVNRYSSGKHSIHFSIAKKGDAPLFFGIITSTKKYDQSFFHYNNSSVHGWYNIETFVIGGKSQKYNEDNILLTGDELILIIDCDDQHIFLQHQRTKRLFQIPVKLEACPFPWKILVGLSNFNDCIRIID